MEENLITIEKLLADNGICMLNGVSNNNNFKHYCFVSTYYKRSFNVGRDCFQLETCSDNNKVTCLREIETGHQ